jgi:hypothetical protein
MANLLARLLGPVNIANGTSTLFTGVAAHTYTLRNIRIVNNTAAAITVRLGIGGVTDALLITPPITIPAGGFINHDCFIVMSGAEALQAIATATGTTITISGLDQS